MKLHELILEFIRKGPKICSKKFKEQVVKTNKQKLMEQINYT